MQDDELDTQYFQIPSDQSTIVRNTIDKVYLALNEQGYDPVSQIVGFIMSGDPLFITNHNNARSMIMRVQRDEIIEELLKDYIKNNFGDDADERR